MYTKKYRHAAIALALSNLVYYLQCLDYNSQNCPPKVQLAVANIGDQIDWITQVTRTAYNFPWNF